MDTAQAARLANSEERREVFVFLARAKMMRQNRRTGAPQVAVFLWLCFEPTDAMNRKRLNLDGTSSLNA